MLLWYVNLDLFFGNQKFVNFPVSKLKHFHYIEMAQYDLHNTMVTIPDYYNTIHGTRYLEKDIERKILQIHLEVWSSEIGWSGSNPDKLLKTQK